MSVVESVGAPLEWWERWEHRSADWWACRPVLAARVRTLRTVGLWVALLVVVLVALTFSSALTVPLSGLLMLLTLYGLARTKTLSWRSVAGLYSSSILWAFVLTTATTWVSTDLVPAAAGSDGRGSVDHDGSATAVAALGEETLKLLPLALLAVIAPGRVRRFTAVDWVLVGYGVGLGFTVSEEMVRNLALEVGSPLAGLVALLLGHDATVTWWPFGRAFESLVETGAAFGGHHVLTGLVATSVGLAVVGARRSSRAGRAALWALLPLAAALVAIVDHFGWNATADGADWLAPGSAVPDGLRWAYALSGFGHLRPTLLALLFLLCQVLDARVLWPVGAIPPRLLPVQRLAARLRAGSAGRSARLRLVVCALDGTLRWAAMVAQDLADVLVAHVPRSGRASDRRAAGRDGLARAMQLRRRRAQAVRARVDVGDPTSVTARRRRVRLAGVVVGAVLLVVGVAGSALLAAAIGADLTPGTGSAWLAGGLDALATWWDGLSIWQQLAVGAVLAALLALSTGSVGLALGVSGIATYGLSHGAGAADLVRDPRTATRSYVETATPGKVLLDLLEFLLTFGLGNGVGAAAGRGLRSVASEIRTDPGAFADARRAMVESDRGSTPLPWPRGPAMPEAVVNATAGWTARRWTFGSTTVLFDRSDLQHVLVRHHPDFWDGTTKTTQTFLAKRMSLDDVEHVVSEVLKQNRDTVMSGGLSRFQVQGVVDGQWYRIGLRDGHVGQAYRLEGSP